MTPLQTIKQSVFIICKECNGVDCVFRTHGRIFEDLLVRLLQDYYRIQKHRGLEQYFVIG
jgi:hypothetical protein